MVRLVQQGLAAIAFYTVLPVPLSWAPEFQVVSRFAPLVGLLIAGLLSLVDFGLRWVAMPDLMRAVVLVLLWVAITGGLHLDGAMDSADGLAVLDPQRRLEVMADSRTGAFGVMAAIALLALKIAAIATLQHPLSWMLLLATGWGRWGQQVAIACYPYLKPDGKGAFHKTAIPSWTGTLPGFLLMLGIALGSLVWNSSATAPWLVPGLGGGAIALLSAVWFNRRLGGHTGDTYGAVVEWTEALTLVLGTLP
ncbi:MULTISPECIES: adenosylcobinamide-GDP ribazoletransferase [unclassified Leptolyngbya]|uniref:adenosylcobinamide-GDP ribazoletransferase n=1 Tax=unclassified Leptolyngbya TaxID=2650499 RepID=UPI00168A190F|nr:MULTISPECIES: adenosylcobinamide-GDP ribazoletransferase [unclassified Leptolyngbya]MBD1911200.1 adenosylcobinamide-GDP ribazoletransferase [Leptolyngbya sp. FACHB-8]MBD2155447.1 adenosylcobinamide-GDP ribazoletransferase [Leptolyngbya sp. FACHB-16]